MNMKDKYTVSSICYAFDFPYRLTIFIWKDCKPINFSFVQKPSRKVSCGVLLDFVVLSGARCLYRKKKHMKQTKNILATMSWQGS